MFPETFQVRYLFPRKNGHHNLPCMFPKLAVRNKDSLSNPACIGLLPDTLDAEVLELRGIDRLNVLYLGGVDDGLTEDVGFKGLSVMAKETLKRVSVVTFRSASYSPSIQI